MKRIYHEVLNRHLDKFRQMAFLMGPRQVGKTTLARLLLDKQFKHLYFNWDRADHRALIIQGPQAVANAAGLQELANPLPILAFDEIHRFGKWKLFLKGFF